MERKTPVGKKGAGLASLALAVALTAGPLTARLSAADVPKSTPEQVKAAEQAEADAAKKAAAEKAKAAAELAKQQAEDKRAASILNEAKQAYEQKNFPQSINKYREFISQFPKRNEVTAAHYGLAIAMAESPDKDWNALIKELEPLVALPDLPDKGRAQYWLGAALRMTGQPQYDAAKLHPEQKDPLAKATERLTQAAGQFAAADASLTATAPKPAGDAKELPPALELAARAKVEGAEVLLKLGKAKEAADLVKVFATDPLFSKSAQRHAALLALGEAQTELHEYPAAFAALSQLAPFDQIGIGLHARYLLGRILEETGQKPEAVIEYETIFKPFLEQRHKAEELLRNRQAMAGKHDEQLRLEEMVRAVPDYVSLANFNAANIQFDYGQFSEAAPKYLAFMQGDPKSPLAPLAQLRAGICQVQQKQPEAMRVLQPLLENAQLGDQATWWAGRLQRTLAEPGNPPQFLKMIQAAIVTFGRAGEKAAALAKTDPAAAARHGDILLDIADSYVLIKHYKEAAPVYETLANDASNPERAEIAGEKLAMALNMEGNYTASDAACAKFFQKYPASMLRPSVMFWQAQNSYQQGVELAKKPDAATPGVQEQIKKLQTQAASQYEAIVNKYPEFSQASAARYGLGMAYYRQGEWEKANKQFERILDSDRTGELVAASYFQADCLIHTMPENADDALSASRLSAQLEDACKDLSSFVNSNEDRPEMPDAMLKLADCYQRNAAILADQQEKAKTLQSARETYDKLLQKYPKHPAYAQAVMERARCIAATGDAGGAINELNRFRNDGQLIKSEYAPLALTRLSSLMVKHGRAVDAVVMLEKARKDYEGELAKDPKRAPWIAGLRYQQGLALKESGKTKEALALFEGVIKDFKDRPEAAEASLASIQVRKDEAVNKLKAARQAIAGLPLDKPADAKMLTAQAEAIKELSEIAAAFGEHADRIADQSAGSDLHIRTLRDAASSWRAVAEAETESVLRTRAEESLKKLKEKLAKDPPVGKSNSVPRPPQIKLASIPISPAEQKARDYYSKALDANADSPLCDSMRLELAQMYVDRGEADPAIQLLSAALDKNPPADQQQQLRIKLGNIYLMKKDAAGALNQAALALADTASPYRAAAYLVKGKAYMLQKNWSEAITVLTRYRSGAARYLNAGPVTEEGLLMLAESYAATKSWGESQATYEHLIGRFGGSKWLPEARFGIGYALQQQKQFDRAVEAYADVTRRTSSEVAARAQYQIGLCRAEQKRWQDAVNELLVVPGTYDYAEWAANASLEAGKALVELKQSAQAKDILQRVVRDHPGTEWAQTAQKRLAEIH